MFDIGWTELAVIAVVALIVIGPKDLPIVLKTLGIWVRKARMLTREFQSSVDDMIREAELDEVRKQALELKQMNVSRQIEKTIDPTGTLRNAFDPEADTAPKKQEAGRPDASQTNAPAAIARTPEPSGQTPAAAEPPPPAPAPAGPPAAPKPRTESTAPAANEKQA